MADTPAAQTLTVTPFEHYMLSDSTANYPMCPAVRLVFSNRFEADRLRAALRATLGRHVLLRSQLRGSLTSRTAGLQWVPQPETAPLEFRDDFCLANLQPLDLDRESGLKLIVVERDFGTEIWLQFHHALTDLGGILRFLQDLVEAYSDPEQMATVFADQFRSDWDWLPRRNRFQASLSRSLRRIPRDLARFTRFHTGRPEMLRPTWGERVGTRPGYLLAYQSQILESEEVTLLRASARRQQVTVNDLLLRDTFTTFALWNQEDGSSGKSTQIRLGVPMNLRRSEDLNRPAANVTGMVFLDRTREQCLQGDLALRSIHREMTEIKRWGMGTAMLRYLQYRSWVPGAINRLVAGQRCLSTGIVSNLGEFPQQSGSSGLATREVMLASIEILPAVRPLTHAIVTALTYGGRLTLNIGYDAGAVSEADASRLLGNLTARLRQSV